METNQVDDEIALALLPRKLFETTDDEDSVFEDALCEGVEASDRNGEGGTRRGIISSTNYHILEDEDHLDDEDNDGDDEEEDPPHDDTTGNLASLRRSERAAGRQIDYRHFHSTGALRSRK